MLSRADILILCLSTGALDGEMPRDHPEAVHCRMPRLERASCGRPGGRPVRVPVAVPYVLGTYAMVTRTIIASDPVAVPYVLGTHAMVTGTTIAYVPAAVPCVLGTRAEDT